MSSLWYSVATASGSGCSSVNDRSLAPKSAIVATEGGLPLRSMMEGAAPPSGSEPSGGNRKIEGGIVRRQRDSPAQNSLPALEDSIDIVRARNPAAQAQSRVPGGTDGVLIVEAEPSGMARPLPGGIEGDDLQIDGLPQPHQVIVGSHIVMTPAERDIQAEAGPHMRHALLQGRSDDGDVVQLQHRITRYATARALRKQRSNTACNGAPPKSSLAPAWPAYSLDV
jgi:hypothetical protein